MCPVKFPALSGRASSPADPDPRMPAPFRDDHSTSSATCSGARGRHCSCRCWAPHHPPPEGLPPHPPSLGPPPTTGSCHPESRWQRLTQSRHESVEEEADDGHGKGHVRDGCSQGALLFADLHHHPAGRGRPPGVRRGHRRRRSRRLGVFVRGLHGWMAVPGQAPGSQEAVDDRLMALLSRLAPSSGGRRALCAARLPVNPALPRPHAPSTLPRAPLCSHLPGGGAGRAA